MASRICTILARVEVKHGVRVNVCESYSDEVGNPAATGEIPGGEEASRSGALGGGGDRAWSSARHCVGFFFLRRPGRVSVSHRLKIDRRVAVRKSEREKQNEYFADGVQDQILTDLAQIADLKVISRASVMQYKSGVARNLRKISEELGVAHVVEGSVQRAANKVRVNAQLIDARNDAHLWAQTYDRDLADVFAIQSEIAKAIADQLQAKLSPNEKKAIEQPPTTDLAAFDLYSRAKSLLLTANFSATSEPDRAEGN